jgi:hypothetical protein
VEAAVLTPQLSASLGLSCRRIATAGNEADGRWGLLPPHPRFPLRSACLADGSLPRATTRLPSCARTFALGHDGTSHQISRVGARMRWQLETSQIVTEIIDYTASPTILLCRSRALGPLPFFEDTPSQGASPGPLKGSAPTAKPPGSGNNQFTSFLESLFFIWPRAGHVLSACARNAASLLVYFMSVRFFVWGGAEFIFLNGPVKALILKL